MQTEQKMTESQQKPEKFNSYNEFLRRFYPDAEKIDKSKNEDSGIRRMLISSYQSR